MSEKKEKHDKNEEVEEQEEQPEEIVIEREPPQGSTDEEKQYWLRRLPIRQGCFDSPIDLNLVNCIPISLPKLEWVNFDAIPKKTKLTNSGHTIIFSAKWLGERPYIYAGPFTAKYVFSNFHLHWGENAQEGSEHTVDGGNFPAELHVVFFKSSYLTQEAALKEQDGCATLAYLIQLQEMENPGFQVIIDSLRDIAIAGTSKRIANVCVLRLFRKFLDDYYLYWGSVSTYSCLHFILWLVTRKPIGISNEQLNCLRNILDHQGSQLVKNFRKVQPLCDRSVFLVNPCPSKYATLLPITHDTYLQYHVSEVFYYKDIGAISKLLKEFLEDTQSISQYSETNELTEKSVDSDEDETQNEYSCDN